MVCGLLQWMPLQNDQQTILKGRHTTRYRPLSKIFKNSEGLIATVRLKNENRSVRILYPIIQIKP